MQPLSDQKILDSWAKNVSPWAKAVQENQIDSRRLVTDQAVVDSVLACKPSKVLDIGCGEGWLVRELSSRGVEVVGVDAVAGLVEKAREQGGGSFHVLEYESFSSNTFMDKFDVAVCNFSLLGKESVAHIFKVIPGILNEGGHFIVQTLHPRVSCGDVSYQDEWREGSWDGFSDEFVDPAPWYFRTLESWMDLFASSGFTVSTQEEPVNPSTGQVASLLMVGNR
jgi:2-polyprenyl-3-methyl-5-hydroxy-6-metoxy-1,4-benzoquinol methylase